MDNFVTELLSLPNTNVLSYKITNETVYIYIESTETKVHCSRCGKETKPKGLGQEVKLRHLPILGRPCYLIIKPKRGICEHCDNAPTTNQRLDWYEYKSRYTKAYEDHVLLSLVNSTVADVSIKEDMGFGGSGQKPPKLPGVISHVCLLYFVCPTNLAVGEPLCFLNTF